MKLIRMLLILVLLACPVHTVLAAEQNFDFRFATWGMTKDEVKKSEVAELSKEESDKLSYMDTVFNRKCDITYKFDGDNGKYLTSGNFTFVFTPNEVDTDINTTYSAVKKNLEEKYKFISDESTKTTFTVENYSSNRSHIILVKATGNVSFVSVSFTDLKYRNMKIEERKKEKERKEQQLQKKGSNPF